MSSERHRYSSSKVHATSFENGHPHRLNVPVLVLPPHLLALRLTYWVAGFFSRSDCCCTQRRSFRLRLMMKMPCQQVKNSSQIH